MQGTCKGHTAISWPVASLYFRSWHRADNEVNSNKGALKERRESHVCFTMGCRSAVLLSRCLWFTVLKPSVFCAFADLFRLYPLLHFVPSKKLHKMIYSLFISIFKVFYHLIFTERTVIFLRGRGGSFFRRWNSVPTSLFLTKTDVTSVPLKQALPRIVCTRGKGSGFFKFHFLLHVYAENLVYHPRSI